MKEILKNSEEMKEYAREFVSTLELKRDRATVIGLYGDLGAGKTTFTQAVAEILGVSDTVASPTFVIMKIYEIKSTDDSLQSISGLKFLVHIDAYRLEKSSELAHLGWQEIISNPENLVLIEWPERVANIMPEHIKINFNHVSENEREVEVKKISN